jgi:chemotaxis protein histidine kinase CheA
MVEAAHGHIDVSTERQQGTSFTIRLPLHAQSCLNAEAMDV